MPLRKTFYVTDHGGSICCIELPVPESFFSVQLSNQKNWFGPPATGKDSFDTAKRYTWCQIYLPSASGADGLCDAGTL